MPYTVQPQAVTTCSDATISAFVIELRDGGGTLLETFTEASSVSTTTGVTYNPAATGLLPSFTVDGATIASELEFNFASFTTSCGTETPNDAATIVPDASLGTCLIEPKPLTTCDPSDVTAFVIELRDNPGGTLLETFTEASTTATTTGVTFNAPAAGQVATFSVDRTSITSDLDFVFVSYTTACGQETINDTVTAKMTAMSSLEAPCNEFPMWVIGSNDDATITSGSGDTVTLRFLSATNEATMSTFQTEAMRNQPGSVAQSYDPTVAGAEGLRFTYDWDATKESPPDDLAINTNPGVVNMQLEFSATTVNPVLWWDEFGNYSSQTSGGVTLVNEVSASRVVFNNPIARLSGSPTFVVDTTNNIITRTLPEAMGVANSGNLDDPNAYGAGFIMVQGTFGPGNPLQFTLEVNPLAVEGLTAELLFLSVPFSCRDNTFPADPDSALTITKSRNFPSGNYVENDVLNFSVGVRNTGLTTLSGINLTATGGTVSGGPIASLAPGAFDDTTFTVDYTVTAADEAAGEIMCEVGAEASNGTVHAVADTVLLNCTSGWGQAAGASIPSPDGSNAATLVYDSANSTGDVNVTGLTANSTASTLPASQSYDTTVAGVSLWSPRFFWDVGEEADETQASDDAGTAQMEIQFASQITNPILYIEGIGDNDINFAGDRVSSSGLLQFQDSVAKLSGPDKFIVADNAVYRETNVIMSSSSNNASDDPVNGSAAGLIMVNGVFGPSNPLRFTFTSAPRSIEDAGSDDIEIGVHFNCGENTFPALPQYFADLNVSCVVNSLTVGGTATFTYEVDNIGAASIHNVRIVDEIAGNLTVPDVLAGQQQSTTFTHTLTAEEIASGEICTRALLTADGIQGGTTFPDEILNTKSKDPNGLTPTLPSQTCCDLSTPAACQPPITGADMYISTDQGSTTIPAGETWVIDGDMSFTSSVTVNGTLIVSPGIVMHTRSSFTGNGTVRVGKYARWNAHSSINMDNGVELDDGAIFLNDSSSTWTGSPSAMVYVGTGQPAYWKNTANVSLPAGVPAANNANVHIFQGASFLTNPDENSGGALFCPNGSTTDISADNCSSMLADGSTLIGNEEGTYRIPDPSCP